MANDPAVVEYVLVDDGHAQIDDHVISEVGVQYRVEDVPINAI